MKTLFITPKVPYPLDTGTNQRIYHLLRAISRVSRVTLAAFLSEESERAELQGVSDFCQEMHVIPPEVWGYHRLERQPRLAVWGRSALEALHPSRPVYLRWWETAQGASLVRDLAKQSFDVVWMERVASLNVAPPCGSSRQILDLDDLEHRKLRSKLALLPMARRNPLAYLEYLRLRRFEKALVGSSYELVVCSEQDKRALGDHPDVMVLPNGVELPEVSISRVRPKNPPEIVFIGTMTYPPNVDAVSHFARDIFPRIKQQVPSARFCIVGRDPAPAVQRLHDGEHVMVTGKVPNVTPHLLRASVAVAPIRVGAGTRIKILEAAAHGTPIVSTKMGVEGLELEDDKHLLIRDGVQSFADACVDLMTDPDKAMRLAQASFQRVEQQYQWNSIEARTQDLLLRNQNASFRGAVMKRCVEEVKAG